MLFTAKAGADPVTRITRIESHIFFKAADLKLSRFGGVSDPAKRESGGRQAKS
jgi:hypothetical protein